jgi:multidrug efflux system membrane fusion protein
MQMRRVPRSADVPDEEDWQDSADEKDEPPRRKKGGPGGFLLIVLGAALVLGILLAFGMHGLHAKSREREETSKAVQAGGSTVQVVKPSKSPPVFDFNLPGSAEALTTATIYARVNGYLKSRLADIGDYVEEGQLLAEIDAPDIDAQFNQARAQVDQNRAAEGIAKVTFERQGGLLEKKVISRQEFDETEAKYNQAVANVKAAEANAQNLSVQQGFKRITAPFTGIVTTRYLNDGALISSGSGSNAQSLFTVAQVDTLRVFIFVPQAYVANIKQGQDVEITLPEYPGQVFHGKVTRSAGALDAVARTERVEIQMPSENGKLRPGMYLTARFKVTQAVQALIVPATTLEIRREGPRVAAVGPDKKVTYKIVALGRDFGKTTEILSGLNGDENLIINPSTELEEGARVEIAKDDPKDQKDDAKGPPK